MNNLSIDQAIKLSCTGRVLSLVLLFVCVMTLTLFAGRSQPKQQQRKEGEAMAVLTLKNANRPLLSYDGQRVVVVPAVGVAEVYHVKTGRKLQTLRVPNSADCAISPDGKQVASWGDRITWQDARHYKSRPVFWLFDVDSGKEISHNDAVIVRDGTTVGYLFALDGSRNVSADLELVANLAPNKNAVPRITLGELKTQRLVREFSFGENSKHGVAGTVVMTPDAKVIAATRRDLNEGTSEQTLAWDTSSGRELLRLPFAATSISLSDDGRRLAVSATQGDNDICEVWSLETGKRISEIGLEFGSRRYLVAGGRLSPDGKLLMVTRRNYLLIWDVDGERLVAAQPVADPNDAVKSVAFSGDGRFVATGSQLEEVRIWQIAEILKKGRLSDVPSLVRRLSQ